MLARLQRTIALTLLLAAAGWALASVALGRPGWATIGAVAIAFSYALVLAGEFILSRAVQDGEAAPLPRAAELLSAWWGEVRTAPLIFFWRQPFRADAEPDFLPSGAAGRRGVVLVHGLFCNRGFWTGWMRRLRGRGVPCVAPNLEPVFASIDTYADSIESAVRRLHSLTGVPVVLVGHSMGGLAIRAWHAKYGLPGRVHRVITIGTPHHGTWMARFARAGSRAEMGLSSAWLARLAARERAGSMPEFTCFYGHCDNIVFPASAACLEGARNIHLPATAHVQMAFHPAVFAETCAALDQKGRSVDSRASASSSPSRATRR